MTRLLLAALLLGAWSCAGPSAGPDSSGVLPSVTETVTEHGDPECAFDETGCLPALLILRVEATPEGPTAVLEATASVEWTEWEQPGTRLSLDWRLPDGSHLVEEGDPAPIEEPGAVAPRVELRLEGDAERVTVDIAPVVDDLTTEADALGEVDLSGGTATIDLDPVTHSMRVRASWPEGRAEFLFTFRRA